MLFHCSLFPKGSCNGASRSPASVPFHRLFSSLMILALATFLFLVVSSTPHPQHPFCKYKPEPSFMGVKISKIFLKILTNHLPKMTVQTNSLNGLTAEWHKCQYRWLYWAALPWREEWKIITACLWEKWKGKTCIDQELWWGPAHHTWVKVFVTLMLLIH